MSTSLSNFPASSWQKFSPESQRLLSDRCSSFDQAWQQGGQPDLSEFFQMDSPSERSALLFELLCVDLRHRAALGRRPQREQYRQRFAEHSGVIDSAFDLLESGQLTRGPAADETLDVPMPFQSSPPRSAEQTLVEPARTANNFETTLLGDQFSKSADVQNQMTKDEASETQVVAVSFTSPPPTTSASTPSGRSATVPVAAQETAIESRGSTNTQPTKPASPRRHSEVPEILGDYDLLEELGRGGMGIVFRAKQRGVNRLVAKKKITKRRDTKYAQDQNRSTSQG